MKTRINQKLMVHHWYMRVLPPTANFAGDWMVMGNTVHRSGSRLVAVIVIARRLVIRHRHRSWYVSDRRTGRHRSTRNGIRISKGYRHGRRLVPVRQRLAIQDGCDDSHIHGQVVFEIVRSKGVRALVEGSHRLVFVRYCPLIVFCLLGFAMLERCTS